MHMRTFAHRRLKPVPKSNRLFQVGCGSPSISKPATFRRLKLLVMGSVLCFLAACQQEIVPTLAVLPPVQAKLLATVYISPTPDEIQQQATRVAIVPTASDPTMTPEPSPTAYIGIFLEGAIDPEGEVPLVDPTRAIFQPQQTAVQTRCRFEVAEVFGTGWRTNASAVTSIGCAVEPLLEFSGAVQVFERGVMYYQNEGGLWAITTEGGVRGDRYWALPAVPETDNNVEVAPAPGLLPPGQQFSTMWRAVDALREGLGYARLPVQVANLSLQRFEGGALLADRTSGLTYILVGTSTAYGPYN